VFENNFSLKIILNFKLYCVFATFFEGLLNFCEKISQNMYKNHLCLHKI